MAFIDKETSFILIGGGGGVYYWEFLTLTLFQTKNVIFHPHFQTEPLKFIPVFRPGL